MMMEIVGRLWSMSLQACVLILVVLIVRVLLRSYPKVYAYSLWILVGVRLLCPVFVEAPFSLQPKNVSWSAVQDMENQTTSGEKGVLTVASTKQNPQGEFTGITIDNGENQEQQSENASLTQQNGRAESENTLNTNELMQKSGGHFWDWEQIRVLLGIIYLAGVFEFTCIYLIQYVLLKRRLATAVRGKGNLWFSEKIGSPFVIGIIHPRIMLPYDLSEREVGYILRHERTHIKHHDPLIRLLGCVCVCLHWWNPLVWLAVSRMNQDMEMYCDEAVVRNASPEERKAYARTLLSFAEKQSRFSMGLAFGESHTEKRVKNLRKKRKGSLIVAGVVALLALFCVAVFLTIPKETEKGNESTAAADGGEGNQSTKEITLTQEDVDYLMAICPNIPEFTSEQDLQEGFFEQFLFHTFRSDTDGETVERYVDSFGSEVPFVKVGSEEVERLVEQVFGKPLSAYVEDTDTLWSEERSFKEGNDYYIMLSDSPLFYYELVSTQATNGMTEVELLENLYGDEDYHCQIRLYLIPADNERGFVVNGKEIFHVPVSGQPGMIEGQSFEADFNPHGQVTFAAYEPDLEVSPYADVTFKLLRDGDVIYEFPANGTDVRQDERVFQNMAAVSFPDLNGDGYTDVVTIADYLWGENSHFSEARIFTGTESGYFLEEVYLEEAYNESHDEKTIAEITEFVAQPQNQNYFVHTSIYGRWKVTEHIPPTGIYALSQEEIESFEGTSLEYGRYWYRWDSQDSCTVENYKKELVTAGEFEEAFQTSTVDMMLVTTAFDYYELEGVRGADSLFGQYFYQIDSDNALIYYEGVFFRVTRE